MNAWYLLSLPALLVLVTTAAIRLADLGPKDKAIRDHARRIGLIGVGFASAMQAIGPLFLGWWQYFSAATWESCLVVWAWCLVWLTTPGMPPWYDLVLGVHRNTDAWRALGWRARIRGELRAIRDSFRLTRNRPQGQP